MLYKKIIRFFLFTFFVTAVQLIFSQQVTVINQKGTKIDVVNNKVTTSVTQPTNSFENDVWFDESTSPTTTKIFDGTNWLTISGGSTVTSQETSLTLTKETIGYVFSSGYIAGDGTNLYTNNATIQRNSVGRYTVAFSTVHVNGANYDIVFGAHESINDRDSNFVQVEEGTQTSTGFDVYVATGDNGTTRDILVDTNWSFQVSGTKEVVTDVALTTTPTPTTGTGVTPVGTLDSSTLVLDNFADANNFTILYRNDTGIATDYEVLISNTPYGVIPNISSGNYTITTAVNGNGTYNHLITSTSPIGAYASIKIDGTQPSPAGTNYNKNNLAPITVTFYTR